MHSQRRHRVILSSGLRQEPGVDVVAAASDDLA
jgi:hypothetical protein